MLALDGRTKKEPKCTEEKVLMFGRKKRYAPSMFANAQFGIEDCQWVPGATGKSTFATHPTEGILKILRPLELRLGDAGR